jgi:HlyD family secretion protein
MRGRWFLISVLAVAAGIAGGFLSMRRRPLPPVTARNPAAAVVAVPEVTLNGLVRPQHVVTAGAGIEGNIDAFLVDSGDEVYQGQVLARIGSAELETNRNAATAAAGRAQEQVTKYEALVNSARLEASRADAEAQHSRLQLERARQVYERQTTLHNAGATPQMTFEKAEKDYEAARGDLEIMDRAARSAREAGQAILDQLAGAKTALVQRNRELQEAESAFTKAEVRSPVDGTVVGRRGEVGKPVQEAGGEMFQIATDLYALEVPVEPEPQVLKRLHPGGPAMVSVLDLQSGGIPAQIKEIKDKLVVVEFNSTMEAIRPGMRAEVRLKLD